MSDHDLKTIAPRLVAMAKTGLLPTSVIAGFMEGFDLLKLTADDHHYLTGPIVVHETGQGWSHELPPWLLNEVRGERVEMMLGLRPEWRVGPAELVAVMYAATCEAPMQSDLGELYCWAARAAMANRLGGHPTEALEQALTQDAWVTHPTDDDVLSPRGRLHWRYREVADVIRSRVQSQSRAAKRVPRLLAA